MRPMTSPMRGAALASCDIVSTVRWASVTARLATSVEVAAWPAISPIEEASSSAELAAAATFMEAAPTRSPADADSADPAPGGRGSGRHAVARGVQRARGGFEFLRRPAHLAERLVDRALEARDGG